MEQETRIGALKLQTLECAREPRKSSEPRPRCFFCHKEVDPELVLMVNNTFDEMICICGKHFHQ